MASSQFKAPVIQEVSEGDYRAYFDSSVLRVWHLRGKERTFKIIGVARLESTFKGQDQKQPLLGLVDRNGKDVLPLALNKTNAKTIAGLYGNNPLKWTGHTITLYPTTTDVGGATTECIRVRPMIPGSGKTTAPATKTNRNGVAVLSPTAPAAVTITEAAPASEREPGDDDETDDAIDSTDDDEEPPPGALETDVVK
jgi:hypothetical protein